MTLNHRRACVKWDLAFKADMNCQCYFMDLCQLETAVTKRWSYQMRFLNYFTAELKKQQQSFTVFWCVCAQEPNMVYN